MIRTKATVMGVLVSALCAAGCGAAAGGGDQSVDEQSVESKAPESRLATEAVSAATSSKGSVGSNQSSPPQATAREGEFCGPCSDWANGGTMVCCHWVPVNVGGKIAYYPECDTDLCLSISGGTATAK